MLKSHLGHLVERAVISRVPLIVSSFLYHFLFLFTFFRPMFVHLSWRKSWRSQWRIFLHFDFQVYYFRMCFNHFSLKKCCFTLKQMVLEVELWFRWTSARKIRDSGLTNSCFSQYMRCVWKSHRRLGACIFLQLSNALLSCDIFFLPDAFSIELAAIRNYITLIAFWNYSHFIRFQVTYCRLTVWLYKAMTWRWMRVL